MDTETPHTFDRENETGDDATEIQWLGRRAIALIAAVAVVGLTAGAVVWLSKAGSAPTFDVVARLDKSVAPPTGEEFERGLKPGRSMVGEPAPKIGFDAFDGTTRSISDYRGRPLVVNFFASWCAPCITEMPGFERVHQKLGDQVAILGLDVNDGETPARALLAQVGITYDTGRDPSGAVLTSFGGFTMPTTVLVRRDGTIVEVHGGILSEAELERDIREKIIT